MEKIALVTGSSRGIGRAVAAELARQGWAVCINYRVREDCARSLLERIPADSREGLLGVLAGDPRPRYQEDPQRVYGLSFAGHNVKFTVDGDRLTVIAVE